MTFLFIDNICFYCISTLFINKINDIDNAISFFLPLTFRNDSHNYQKCAEKVIILILEIIFLS